MESIEEVMPVELIKATQAELMIRAGVDDDTGADEAEKAINRQVGGDHYRKYGDMQPIHILRRYLTPEEFRGYTKGVAIVYLLREAEKGGDQDIRKAAHHLELWEELK